jgi:hypothetical protein
MIAKVELAVLGSPPFSTLLNVDHKRREKAGVKR